MGAPRSSSARSTISMARSTPAQKPRGLASTIFIRGTYLDKRCLLRRLRCTLTHLAHTRLVFGGALVHALFMLQVIRLFLAAVVASLHLRADLAHVLRAVSRHRRHAERAQH